ncbi:uncharacterized protein [Dermacentor andersoni]|uniref:uncharacterized protein isoform X3 n=1 Tax=Dermacentor andersoni TaxID=34620 RepID=UPI0024179C04|nr:uncharacterized protein LOC129381386 isoform X5 [Dermacentor andersoni]
MADERSYEYTPPEFSMTDETTASTSCGGTPGASSALDAYTTIPDDAWKYPWNTQPMPITDGTYSVEGDTENGMTSYQELGCVSSIENARPSTIRAGMDAASANFEDGATIPETTLVDPLRRQYHPAHSTSTVCGTLLQQEEGNSKSCAVSAAMLRADGAPHRVTLTNTRSTQPTSAKLVISRL